MSERREYELTDEQYLTILEASRSVPVMFTSGGTSIGGSPQENANRAWERLGREMGFQYLTVEAGRSKRHFTALPTPPPVPRAEMTDADFRLFCDLAMSADPSPWTPEQDAALRSVLDREARARGHNDWIEALHEPA